MRVRVSGLSKALPRPAAARWATSLRQTDPYLWALGLFVLLTLLMDWPWLSGRVTIPWDAKAVFAPQVAFLAKSLHQGQAPFWTPFAFSGHPQIADPQAMMFAPPFLALAVISASPSLWAVDVTVLGVVCLGGAALLLWFRDRGWHWAGGLIAALVFSFGASMAWRIQHVGQVLSLAYLPLALICLDRMLARRSRAYAAALGAVAGLIALDRDQVALLVLYLLAALLLWQILSAPRPRAALRRAVSPLLVAGLTGAVVTIIPFTLTVLFVAHSNRPFIDFIGAGRGSLHPALLLTLVMPDLFGAGGRMEDYWGPPSFAWPGTGLFVAQNMGVLYVGMIPLGLLLRACSRGELWAADVRFFSCAAAVSLLYALGWYTPFFGIAYALLPGVALYRRPADATFLIGALAAILAGYAAHRLFRAGGARLGAAGVRLLAATGAASVLVAVALAIALERGARLGAPLLAAGAWCTVALLALKGASRRILAAPLLAGTILAVATAADLAVNNGPNSATALPPAIYEVLEPTSGNATIAALRRLIVDSDTRRDRIELAGLGFHWPSASLVHGLENTLGYNPLRLALYSAATGAQDNVGLPEERKFSALFPSYRSTLANLLGLRYIASGVPISVIDSAERGRELPLIARTADAYIYENRDACDRVLFATSARAADFARLLADGQWPDVDLATTVLLPADALTAPSLLPGAPRRPGRARILSYANDEVVIAADSPDGGWVVLNDVWHPWWFAEIDGAPVNVLRANVLFRALAVGPGRHLLRFRFRPLAGALAELLP